MKILSTAGGQLWLMCPGCKSLHHINTEIWTWDGDTEKPTISPSILAHRHKVQKTDTEVTYMPQCHSFVRAGVWEFLSDSEHELAGQHVPMKDEKFPEWLVKAHEAHMEEQQ